jgi:DNA invertase Pin-like site-specific DNA recombinase
MNDVSKVAVILCRKSGENAKEDDFEIQERICREYADSKGYRVYRVYHKSHSGQYSPWTRHVLQEAKDDIKSGKASVLIVRTLERLARDPAQAWYQLFEIENRCRGRVEAAQENLDRSSPIARMQLAVLIAAGDMERERITQRLTAGKLKRASRGHLTGGPNARYGYRYVDDVPGQRTAYVINPDTAPIVQRIFEQAGQGMPLRAIARGLNMDGIPTPLAYAASQQSVGARRVGKYWQVQQLRSILKDSRYAGHAVLFRYTTTRDDDTGKRSYTINENPMPAPSDTWPAIVTEEAFALATMRQDRQVAGRKPLIQALLRGHAYCGICGGTLGITTIKGGKATKYYCRSSSRVPTVDHCPGTEIRLETLDQDGWNAIKQLLLSRERFVTLLRERYAPKHDYRAYLESTAGALREKREELTKLSESIGLSPNATVHQTLIARMEQVAEDVEKLEKQHSEAQSVAESGNASEVWIQEVLTEIYGWAEVLSGPIKSATQDIDDAARAAEAWLDRVDALHSQASERVDALDTLPFEMKRVAVEASGIVVKLYPAGSPKRVHVSFDKSMSGTTIDTNASALVEVATPGRSR